jgi:hypothetical protein
VKVGHLISGTVLYSDKYGMQWWLLTHTVHILHSETEHLLLEVESLRNLKGRCGPALFLRNILLSFIATQK